MTMMNLNPLNLFSRSSQDFSACLGQRVGKPDGGRLTGETRRFKTSGSRRTILLQQFHRGSVGIAAGLGRPRPLIAPRSTDTPQDAAPVLP
jgi:hypothetical protein